jgi:hypothetical protein
MDYTVLVLKRAFDMQEAIARDNDAVLLEGVGREYNVGDAGFVFEGEEDESFGGAGALARDYTSGNSDMLITASLCEFVR